MSNGKYNYYSESNILELLKRLENYNYMFILLNPKFHQLMVGF